MGASQRAATQAHPIVVEDGEDNEPESIDELYITLRTNIVGVQYYTRLRAPFRPIPGLWTIPGFGHDPALEQTSMGWEIRPEGLGHVLDMVHKYDRFPRIVVTEGGASFVDTVEDGRVHDGRRIAYYQAHLQQVLAARARGVPVDGYFCWSLLDITAASP